MDETQTGVHGDDDFLISPTDAAEGYSISEWTLSVTNDDPCLFQVMLVPALLAASAIIVAVMAIKDLHGLSAMTSSINGGQPSTILAFLAVCLPILLATTVGIVMATVIKGLHVMLRCMVAPPL